MAENGDFREPRPDRLDRFETSIQGLITLAHEQQKTTQDMLAVIQESRAEIRDLIELQKEQRIDIMALFAANRDLRDTFQQYFEKHP